MTISTLARRCGVSRTTLLYYESQGLLRKPPRTTGRYRSYTEEDLQRVQQIRQYRHMGLAVPEIRTVLKQAGGGATAVLERRLAAIDAQIETLRSHQQAILLLLQRSRRIRKGVAMNKDKWIDIMRAAGFAEADMHRWHREFEKSAPEDHQEFLEFLHIDAGEIARIRAWSRAQPEGAR